LWERPGDALDVIAACGWLLIAWLSLDVLPGRLYRKLISPSLKLKRRPPEDGRSYAKRVHWAVRASSKRVPWRTVCFHEGIAAHQMLCRAGIQSVMHYGVAKSDGGMEAHVWVTVDDRVVVGGETKDRFTPLAAFEGKA
jgi:hypothetical protein